MLVTSVMPLATLTLVVLGVILFGITTATESAAVGAAGAFLMAWQARTLTLQRIKEAVFLTAKTTAMQMMDTTSLPPGDGHPVVVFPGLAADQRSIAPLVSFCDRLGYTTYDWGRGLNTGPQGDVNAWIDDLAQHVGRLVSAHRERVSLVGWSLGGLYAREVAKILGRRVRQVITIGTPFTGTVEQKNASWLYRLVSGPQPLLDEKLLARIGTAPDVPTTSIFSRSDGVVA